MNEKNETKTIELSGQEIFYIHYALEAYKRHWEKVVKKKTKNKIKQAINQDVLEKVIRLKDKFNELDDIDIELGLEME